MSHYLSIRGIGQPIAYFPKLSIYLGCINAGVFLGQMIFWHDKTENPLGVYKTAEEITQETGLSYKQQVNARKKLVSLGLITETYKRLDHRLFFKFNVERFDEWFTEMLLANEPNVSSRTAQTEVREEPKGQIVIQKNTTENTTDINTSNDDQNSVDQVLNLWKPNLNTLNVWLQRSGEQEMNESEVIEVLIQVNAHYEKRITAGSISDNQMYSNFVKWIKSSKKPLTKKQSESNYKKQPHRFGQQAPVQQFKDVN